MKEQGSEQETRGEVKSGLWAVGLDAAGELQEMAEDTPQSCAHHRGGRLHPGSNQQGTPHHRGIAAAAATNGCLRGASGH